MRLYSKLNELYWIFVLYAAWTSSLEVQEIWSEPPSQNNSLVWKLHEQMSMHTENFSNDIEQ